MNKARNGKRSRRAGANDCERRARFGRYFPRLFAYASSYLAEEGQARDVVAETFRRAFAFPDPLSEEEFRIVLFGLARRLCHSLGSEDSVKGLTEYERDVISLVFDAQLPREEIGSLLRIKEEMVGTTLLRALRKLRAAAPSPFALSPLGS